MKVECDLRCTTLLTYNRLRRANMSLPVSTFYCDKCDFEQGNAGTWGMKDYVLASGVRVSVNWQLGWCFDCDGLTAIEDLSLSKCEENYTKRQQILAEHLLLHRPASMSKTKLSEWENCHYYLTDEMDEVQDVIDMLKNRMNPARCLACGSTRVLADFFTNNDSWDQSQPKATGSKHPGCGGEIWMKESELRLAMKPSISSYTPEGDFIDRVHVPGYTVPDDEYYLARDIQNAKARGKTMPLGDRIWFRSDIKF